MIAEWRSKLRDYLNPMTSEEKLLALEDKAKSFEKRAEDAKKEAEFRIRIANADAQIKASKARLALWSKGTVRFVLALLGLALVVLFTAQMC